MIMVITVTTDYASEKKHITQHCIRVSVYACCTNISIEEAI